MDASAAQDLLSELGPCERMPTMPGVVTRALEMIQAGDADGHALGDVIAQDPVVAGRLLQLANGALLTGAAGPVDSVGAAVMRLGLTEVGALLATLGAVDAFPDVPGLDLVEFWRHCSSTAVATGRIARLSSQLPGTTGHAVGGAYYLAGLFHDVGVLVCSTQLGRRYQQVLEENRRAQEPLFVTEERQLGFHHGQVGAALARHWGLPDSAVAGAEWHHDPMRPEGEERAVAAIVHLADWMINHLGVGNARDGYIERFDDQAWQDIGLDLARFPEMLRALEDSGREARDMLGSISPEETHP